MLRQDKYGGQMNFFKVFGLTWDYLLAKTEKHFPLVHGVIFTDDQLYFWYRTIIGFFFGSFAGMVFYETILASLAFERGTLYFLGMVFALTLAYGCSFSSQIRCITWLTSLAFCDKAGRHIVKASVVSMLLTGPVVNIVDNTQEIVRMFACSNQLAHNISQMRYNLLVKPFKVAFLGAQTDTDELKEMLGSVNNVVETFSQEIEGVDDTKLIQEENDYMDDELNDTSRSAELDRKYSVKGRTKRSDDLETSLNVTNATDQEAAYAYQQNYFKKLEIRCENIKTGMGKMCKNRFAKFKEKCDDAIHWSISWAICWPMKLDFICDLVKVFTYGGYDCDPSNDVSKSIGEGYVTLKRSGDTMKAGVMKERTQFKLLKPPNLVGLYSTLTITKEFIHEINSKKAFADAILMAVKTVLAFMFILVIRRAADYHSKYVSDLSFDNLYVTAEYRMLDAYRRHTKRRYVLPQTKAECTSMADPYSLFLSPAESKSWAKEFWSVMGLLFGCSLILGIDFVLKEVLKWMHDNLEFSYTESGIHHFEIQVGGIGFVAAIVRSIIKGFHFKKEVKGEVTNRHCLPIAKALSWSQYLWIYGLCLLLAFIAYVEGYIKRLRRCICSFYYPKQETLRIEYLYKKTLAFRNQLFQKKTEGLYEKAKKNQVEANMRFFYRLYRQMPWFVALRLFSCARHMCVTCGDPEPVFTSQRYIQCTSCQSYYCLECWVNHCQACFICTSYERIKSKYNTCKFVYKSVEMPKKYASV